MNRISVLHPQVYKLCTSAHWYKRKKSFPDIWLCNRSHLNFLICEENFLFFISAFGDLLQINVEYENTLLKQKFGNVRYVRKKIYFYGRLFRVIPYNIQELIQLTRAHCTFSALMGCKSYMGVCKKSSQNYCRTKFNNFVQIHVRLGDFDKKSDNGVEFLVQGTAKVNYN